MTEDDQKLAHHATTLLEAAVAAIPAWMSAAIASRAPSVSVGVIDEATERAMAAVVPQLQALLDTDIDEQRTTPLAVLRGLVPFAAEVLDEADAPTRARDADAIALHPDDHHDLTPGGFADFGEAVQTAGLTWGAAKAHVHLARRRAEGLR